MKKLFGLTIISFLIIACKTDKEKTSNSSDTAVKDLKEYTINQMMD